MRDLRPFAALVLLVAASALAQPAPPPPPTPAGLRAALAANPGDAQAAQLADKLQKWMGKDLAAGTGARVEGLEAAFAVEVPGAKKAQAVSVDGSFHLALQPVGSGGLFAGAAALSDGTGMRWAFDVDGKHLGGGQLEAYAVHPDSLSQPGVLRGKVLPQRKWKSHVFDGTERDWWIYVPAQYRPSHP